MSRPDRSKRCDFYSDTDPAALEVFLDLTRRKAPEEKLAMVFDAIHFIHDLVEAGIRRQYPARSGGRADPNL